MKSFLVFSASFYLIFSAGNVFAQQGQKATTEALAKVEIVTPISVEKTFDLNFGNVAVSAATGGTVKIDETTGIRTSTMGVTLPSTSGTVQRAQFLVKGVPFYSYTITLPSQINVTDGTNIMLVDNFKSNPLTTGTLNNIGEQILYVGATISVNPNQLPGSYATTGSGFQVVVQYN